MHSQKQWKGRHVGSPMKDTQSRTHHGITRTCISSSVGKLRLPRRTEPDTVVESIKSAFDLVWHRADTILENSDSCSFLGKDVGPALDRLKRIAAKLEVLGYYTYIIKEQPDKAGESVIQKVLRYALSSKFVLIENTEPSGHLYEIPHVAKAAECVTVVLQEEGKRRDLDV